MRSSKLFAIIFGIGVLFILVYSFFGSSKNAHESFIEDYVNGMISGENAPAKGFSASDFSFFEYTPDWLIRGTFKPLSGASFTLLMTDSTIESLPLVGSFSFEKSGKNNSLLLFDEGEQFLLPFYDLSNGGQTYGGGRYINVPKSNLNGDVLEVDFNKAFNFYCAYTPSFVCPLPPKENRLDLEVNAGEKIPNK